MRLKIIRIVVACLFLTLAGGLIFIQVIRGPFYYGLSTNNRIRVVPIEGRRGRIFDRNGVLLAGNRISFDVAVVPQEIDNKKLLFEYLSDTLKIDRAQLFERFDRATLTPFTPAVIARDIDRSAAIVFEENKFIFPGLIIQVGSRRHYPLGEVSAHAVGYVGHIDRGRKEELKEYGYIVPSVVGYSGVEEFYNTYLKGQDGGMQLEVNNRGQQVRVLSTKEPVSGQDIAITIDARMQQIAAAALEESKGAVVMIDLDNGEILCLVSKPAFDPNAFVSENSGKLIASFFADPNAPFLNRTIGGQYPAGSTFKVVGAVAALETKKITPQTTFSCPGYYQLGRRRFLCNHSHGIQNLTEAIARSCNVYFYNIGLLLGPDILSDYAQRFGFGNLTNIDLPYEVRGLVPSRAHKRVQRKEGWYDGDTLNFSIGQGDVLVTPLQLVQMMALVANDGRQVQPHLIKSFGIRDVVRRIPHQDAIDVNPATLAIIKAGLRAAVGDYSGTAHILNIRGLSVSGKTGTAQTTPGRQSHAWFVGFLESGERRIVFCVFLEHGGSSAYAGRVARRMLIQMQQEGIL